MSELCYNCSEPNAEFVGPPFPTIDTDWRWCNARCFLAYTRNAINPPDYERLRAEIQRFLGSEIEPYPSRFLLLPGKDQLTIAQYKGEEPVIESEPKRTSSAKRSKSFTD